MSNNHVQVDSSETSPSSNNIVNTNENTDKLETTEILESESLKLKPRLVGKKLTNVPSRMTGKEVSGLCTIC